LLFSWIAVFMYEGDAPIAERRAAALSLDRELLRDVLGAEELRELLDADVLADLELELQLLVDGRRARDADELHDVLRRLGPLNRLDLDARSVDGAPVGDWVRSLLEERRAIEVRIAGDDRIAASDDAARLRDAIGVALPVGLPAVFTDPVPDPLGDLCRRYARTHGPFLVGDVARWRGVDEGRVAVVLDRLVGDGALVRGEFRPEGTEREFCDDDVLRQLRRRSLAALRREIEPVEGDALARFLPAWQGVGSRRRGVDAVAETVAQLQGAAIAASVLERDVLTGRVNGYRPSDLDSCARAARSCGWVAARSEPPTVGSGCCFAIRCRCWRSTPASAPTTRPAMRCGPTSGRKGRRFGPTSSLRCRPPNFPTTPTSCTPRCGISSGPARSPTIRWRRCGR